MKKPNKNKKVNKVNKMNYEEGKQLAKSLKSKYFELSAITEE